MTRHTFYTKGKRGSIVALTATVYEGGAIVVSAEDEQLTENQFKRGVALSYPDTAFRFERERGYFYARSAE